MEQSAVEKFNAQFEKEKQLTREALADVLQFLSHSTCSTRGQLTQELRQRISVIQAEISINHMCDASDRLVFQEDEFVPGL